MDIVEIKKTLKSKYNVEFIGIITYNNTDYIQCRNSDIILYYELLNNEIVQVVDEQIIKYFRLTFECKKGNKIY